MRCHNSKTQPASCYNVLLWLCKKLILLHVSRSGSVKRGCVELFSSLANKGRQSASNEMDGSSIEQFCPKRDDTHWAKRMEPDSVVAAHVRRTSCGHCGVF